MLRDAKTDDVRVIDVRKRDCDFTDEFVIATARSKLHAQTAAQAVVYRVRILPSCNAFQQDKGKVEVGRIGNRTCYCNKSHLSA